MPVLITFAVLGIAYMLLLVICSVLDGVYSPESNPKDFGTEGDPQFYEKLDDQN